MTELVEWVKALEPELNNNVQSIQFKLSSFLTPNYYAVLAGNVSLNYIGFTRIYAQGFRNVDHDFNSLGLQFQPNSAIQQVQATPQISNQVQAMTQVSNQVQATAQVSNQVQATPPVSNQVQATAQISNQVQAMTQMSNQVQAATRLSQLQATQGRLMTQLSNQVQGGSYSFAGQVNNYRNTLQQAIPTLNNCRNTVQQGVQTPQLPGQRPSLQLSECCSWR